MEVSRLEGLKPTSATFLYAGRIPIIPGVSLGNPGVTIDPVNKRYGAGVVITVPGGFAVGGTFTVENGAFKQVGADVRVPAPGIFLGPQLGGTTLESFGATFTAGGGGAKGVAGVNRTAPFRLEGRASLSLGPIIVTPAGSASALVADIDMVISGPAIQFTGSAEALGRLLKLGEARLLLSANPFRLEAEANVAFPSASAADRQGAHVHGDHRDRVHGPRHRRLPDPGPGPDHRGPAARGRERDRVRQGDRRASSRSTRRSSSRSTSARPSCARWAAAASRSSARSRPFITVQPQPLSLAERISGQAPKGGDAVGDAAFDVAAPTGDAIIQVGGGSRRASASSGRTASA